MQNSSKPEIRSNILKATYLVFKSSRYQSLYPLSFRWELCGLIGVDEDRSLAIYELNLLNDGWIKQRKPGDLIKPTKKLINKFDGLNIELKDRSEPEVLIISDKPNIKGTLDWYAELARIKGREEVMDELKIQFKTIEPEKLEKFLHIILIRKNILKPIYS